MKLKKFFKVTIHSNCISLALLTIRIVAGAAFMIHGWGKIQNAFGWMGPQAPVPAFLQFLAALSEFGGGLCWIVGLILPLASAGIGVTMIVATLLHMVMLKDPFVSMSPGGGSYELAAIYLTIALLFLATGPGKYSLDSKIFGEQK
ncbi:MAG: DoxX family protein [Proteobacteria bacterium]|nr:DoxX family protein [Pseudomonadota bacterium]